MSAEGRESVPLTWSGDEPSACLPGFVVGRAQEVGTRNSSHWALCSERPASAGKTQSQGYLEEVKEDVQEPVRPAGLEWRRLETVLILDMMRVRSKEASSSVGLKKELGADYTIWVPLQ